MLANDERVLLYNSVYRTLYQATKTIILTCFQPQHLIQVNRQRGELECGVFAVAISTALSFQQNPALITFDQHAYVGSSGEKGQFSPFPTV